MTIMATPHEPKQDRSRATRQRLLEATIDCLAEMGWAAATVAVVAERAGVSRGAAQHHFPTREDLITAALEYMFDTRNEQARREAEAMSEQLDGIARTEAVVEGLVESYTSPLFKAALQVWTHAAADPVLRERIVPLEAKFGRASHRRAVEALGVDDSDPVAHHLVQATLDLARGLGLADVLTDDSARRKQIIHQWAVTLHSALHTGVVSVAAEPA
ncbi:transcriptional regulator, TetR family [Nocardia farcinica]|uniref:HTH-type transcriptional repressor AcnR n=4 Tax=Nocardiaceae TaxID=85025 RepID=A0A0H5P202_NOCFR|nr:putative HTH-type transcriptional regulator [Nocardia farcinica]BAD60178.1 putative transcriptional regulator [Nocardia farcinica IFM 10152]PFX08374.1 putative HTH-type transcriptional regulator [Nocardia farcinica]CRY81687.1 HTH-type transcriptional repressor AcnR [Nocardia farcinica]SIT15089.1 transcriptional regulator, TetR family [Nocardia farcinica]